MIRIRYCVETMLKRDQAEEGKQRIRGQAEGKAEEEKQI